MLNLFKVGNIVAFDYVKNGKRSHRIVDVLHVKDKIFGGMDYSKNGHRDFSLRNVSNARVVAGPDEFVFEPGVAPEIAEEVVKDFNLLGALSGAQMKYDKEEDVYVYRRDYSGVDVVNYPGADYDTEIFFRNPSGKRLSLAFGRHGDPVLLDGSGTTASKMIDKLCQHYGGKFIKDAA